MQELLQSAAAAPGTQVARLDLITPSEVTQVLKTFNAWDLPYTELLNPERQTIHGMFEHWAQHTPEAPALTFGVSISLNVSRHMVDAVPLYNDIRGNAVLSEMPALSLSEDQ